MKLSDTTAKVIDLATAIRDYWNSELPKRHPNYPVITLDEDSGPPPPEEAELTRFLDALPDEDVYNLLLLMYLGRGNYGTDELAMHLRTLKDKFPQRGWAISQLQGKAPLADYLTDGIGKLQKSGIDVNHMALTSV